jgi:hypothetical protein
MTARRNYAIALEKMKIDCDGDLPDGEHYALQHRSELVLLCKWIEKKTIRSYLELGFYRGGLMSVLSEIFRFEKIAGCDEGLVQARRELKMKLPLAASVCLAKTESPAYRRFRHALGMIDLVFIDADHSYGSVRQDYEREKKQPHRFLAFHDIKNIAKAPGVVRLWNELGGKKRELYVPRPSGGDEMGIGLWSQKETP